MARDQRLNRHLAGLTVWRGDRDGEERVGMNGARGSRFGLRPGDAFWADWYHRDPDGKVRCCVGWDGCEDPRGHLVIVLPDLVHFDTTSRASNCTLKDDRKHRCWSVEGTPEGGDLTLGKRGPTCAAGAGSIATGTWHGFVHRGLMYVPGEPGAPR